MQNLLNPKWLFVINTLPLIILFALCNGQFSLIKTLLTESNIQLWTYFGVTLAILGISNFGYAAYLTYKKQNVSVLYAIAALLCYIPYIYLYAYYFDKILPFDIPQWIASDNLLVYAGTFIMPTLVYSLFVLVSRLTPGTKHHKAWVNFLAAISIPVLGYLFSQIVSPLWRVVEEEFSIHALLIIIITATLVFLFFLIRGIFIIAARKSVIWQKYQLAWEIPVALIFPILGLLINNGSLFDRFSIGNSGIFGDFSNKWFYIMAVVNGIAICMPNPDNKIYRIILFAFRSITFAYTFYFFLVFLPFLPLSVVAIIAIGTGFLMLTPLALFIIHINALSKDLSYLKAQYTKKTLTGILLSGILSIPIFITIIYLKDKSVLNETLEYIYSSDYSKQYNIDKHSLKKTMNVVKGHKDRNRDFIFGNQTPYLSSYFNWVVLDNLTLSDSKINQIEKIFFDTSSFQLETTDFIRNENVKITNITSKSTFDTAQQAWVSWIDIEITNKGTSDWFSEYATTIDLPEGCWISDYYLYVNDKKEHGLLSEKKSAMWVFSNIRNENRDPGILYYLTGNKVAFRVFPFSKGEIRKTGIEFLHKEPVQLKIDSNIVELGNHEQVMEEYAGTENIVYVSTQQKRTLKLAQRKPVVQFLVDASNGKDRYVDTFTNQMEKFVRNNKDLCENAQISFVNSFVHSYSLDKDWKQNYKAQTFGGGFYLEKAVNTTLFNAYEKKIYPIIIVVTDKFGNAIISKDFSDFKFAFPESNLFFELNSKGNLDVHSLVNNPLQKLPDSIPYSFEQPVLEYKLSDNSTTYLPADDNPAIILRKDIFETLPAEIKEKNWQSALVMQGRWVTQILHPEISDKEWLRSVRYSFISKVMTPVTSYLVVENDAQKAILKKKQEQVLSGNKSLDLDDDTQRMSEPGFWIMAFFLLIILGCKEIIRKQKQHS